MSAYNKIGFLGSSVGGMSTTVGTGSNQRNFGIGDYVRQLDAAGIPAAIACNDGNGGIMDALNLILNGSKVPHVLGYRIVKPDDKPVEHYSVPDYMLHPGEAAQKHFNLLKPVIERKVDLPKYREHLWWFPVNEVRAKRAVDEAQYNDMNAWDWMGEFCYEFTLLANREGYKVAMPQANSGEPKIKELDDVAMDAWKQPGMKKFLQLCAERPQQVCVGLHEYSWEVSDDKGGILAGYPTKVGRFQYLFRACDEMGIARPNVIFGEWGWKHDQTPPPEVAIRHIQQVAEIYARHPQILGAFIWYMGPYQNSNINNDTVRLLEPVTRKTLEWRFPDPQPNGPLDIATQAKPKEKETESKPVVVMGKRGEETDENQTVWGTVNSQFGLNLRTEPATEGGDSTVKVMLENGTRLKILATVADQNPAKSRRWYQVEAAGETGYVATDFVIAEQAAPKEAAKEATRKATPARTHALETGMNINPDAPHSNPLHDGVLKGLDWVRFPFKAADKRRSVTDSFSEYDPIIQGYANQGVGSLVVLNQQTVAGNEAPWPQNNWAGLVSQYADKFAAAAGEIAAHYAHLGEKVAYQIWNEGDNPETPWVSVHVPPEHFAVILSRAARAIRAASPKSPIVFGGLSTGPDQAAAYVRACRQALGGDLPVDAIGIHPYGRWPIERPFPDWTIGRLDDAFAVFKRAVPDKPLWITEIGIPGHANPIGEQHYPTIAKYLRDMYTMVAGTHAAHVPVIIWFAWSDNMENAGIVTADGRHKAHLFDAFTAVRDRQIIS